MAGVILFVCTGNTCRSPMAAAIANDLLQSGVIPGLKGWTARSAGVWAGRGAPATPEAVEALRRVGISLEEHRSTPLTSEAARHADVVYPMAETHAQSIRELAPEAHVVPLSPFGDIADPVGQRQEVYDQTARELRWLIEWRLKELAHENHGRG